MPPSSTRWTIYAATAANLAIAITKFIAAAETSSGAMFSEGLHSVVDTGDDLLLLLGLYLSRRPASAQHPYGHGRQLYFVSMVVAMTIFGMGGGASIYEGVLHAIARHPLEARGWAFLVLAIAFVFEGLSFLVARKQFAELRGGRGVWEAIQRSKDPTTFVVVLEDGAALIGIAFATIGIALGAPIYDALASILIGLLLVAVAFVLGRETWSLLLGEAAEPELVESVRALAVAQPGIVEADAPRTVHLAPDLVHVDLDVKFDRSLSAGELQDSAHALEEAVHARHPEVHRVSLRFSR